MRDTRSNHASRCGALLRASMRDLRDAKRLDSIGVLGFGEGLRPPFTPAISADVQVSQIQFLTLDFSFTGEDSYTCGHAQWCSCTEKASALSPRRHTGSIANISKYSPVRARSMFADMLRRLRCFGVSRNHNIFHCFSGPNRSSEMFHCSLPVYGARVVCCACNAHSSGARRPNCVVHLSGVLRPGVRRPSCVLCTLSVYGARVYGARVSCCSPSSTQQHNHAHHSGVRRASCVLFTIVAFACGIGPQWPRVYVRSVGGKYVRTHVRGKGGLRSL